MHHVIQRLGFRVSRGFVVLVLIAAVLAGGAFWIGPLRPVPAELRLVVLAPDGQFRDNVNMPHTLADTFSLDGAAVGRYPLLLGAYNEGARSAEPVQLALSLPGYYRLTNGRGEAYPPRVTPGNPLARYVFDLRPASIHPGEMPHLLGGLDTLWLEPIVPSYYCTAYADSIPEFLPAPPQNPALLANVNIFYSFTTRTAARQTGILNIQLDPNAVQRQVVAPVSSFPTVVREPEIRRPQLPSLTLAGVRVSQCGDAAHPLEIQSTLYHTPEGGRVFVLTFAGAVRKYMYDLNRDSIIELEVWDPDNDGLFEAARAARMPIPEFLMPLRPPRPPADSILVDSTGTPLDSVAVDSVRAVHDSISARADSLNRQADRVRTFRYPPALFRDTAAGPFRFWRAQQQQQAESGERARTQPRPAAPTGPRLLGVPVDSVRTRSDTIRRDTSSVRIQP